MDLTIAAARGEVRNGGVAVSRSIKIPDFILPPGMQFWQGVQFGYVPLFKCPEYIAWLHTLPCVVRGTKPVTVHHIIGHGLKCVGGKTHDLLAIPLTPELHQDGKWAIHEIGGRRWEVEFGSQLEFSAKCLLQAVYEGVLKL